MTILFQDLLTFRFKPKSEKPLSFSWPPMPIEIELQQFGNQIYLVTLTQASFLPKNQMLQNGFLTFLMLR